MGRAIITRSDAGTLLIEVPPAGFGMDSAFTGAFAAAWFSAIVPATLSMAGPPALFMLPFWAAGALVAKQAVVDPTTSVTLSVGQFAWRLEKKVAGFDVKRFEGATKDLRGAGAEVVAYVNGVPQTALKMYDSAEAVSLGISLAPEECESLADEINRYLDELDAAQS